MKTIKFTVSTLLVVLTFSVFAVFAGNTTIENNKTLAKVAQNLSAKLKTDLVTNNVTIKFTNVEKDSLTNNKTILKGDALAVLSQEQTELPIKFEATVNESTEIVNAVEYNFIESDYAPTTDEEVLMRHLLKQISADYKTENVVIAIDGFDTLNAAGNQKEFKGLAEVRVGEVEWKKIDFDVVMNDENAVTKVEYKLKN